MLTRLRFLSTFVILTGLCSSGLSQQRYTHADSLKGTYTKERAWWDVLHYDLAVSFNIPDSSVQGRNQITYKVTGEKQEMQIDLLSPMIIDSIFQDGRRCALRRDEDAYFVSLPGQQVPGAIGSLLVYFHGRPRVAKMPPWDGGIIWARDQQKNPWVSIACQGMAARVWFPNKDHQADEPDSVSLHFTVPAGLMAVSNGKLKSISMGEAGTLTYHWSVSSPINNYNIIPYIGKYTVIKDTLMGKDGVLDLEYWVLMPNEARAKKHFVQVKPMLRCFEDWFGPFPFYADGYKLVEAPFLGMEHQSAIAYGNEFQNGYRGRDLSLTGWGLKWDFIIVHESGHEWFGNNITAKDVADNWIHESFTAYSENLYTEYLFGKQAGAEYVIGTRGAIQNDKPVIADYDVNAPGSLDLYYKGANMLHTIRQIVNNDSLWKEMLRGLNRTFRHQTVTTGQIETYMSGFLRLDLRRIFDQYLRTIQVPVLEYKIRGGTLSYRWSNCVKEFDMPLAVQSGNANINLRPTTKWQKLSWKDPVFIPDLNYYIGIRQVK